MRTQHSPGREAFNPSLTRLFAPFHLEYLHSTQRYLNELKEHRRRGSRGSRQNNSR